MNARNIVVVLVVVAAVGALVRFVLLREPEGRPMPTPGAGSSPGPAGTGDAVASDDRLVELRRSGHIEEAMQLARVRYQATKDPKAMHTFLGLCEDSGKAAECVREGGAYLATHPSDTYVQWMLARALLFQAATDPKSLEFKAWVDEAEKLVDGLDKARFSPREAPGGRLVARMQIAFLRRQWKQADAFAEQALAQGTTAGESADIVALRFDVAIREGRLDDAQSLLDKVVGIVESWKEPSYYQLRTYMEDVLEVREIYFGKRFTLQDIADLEARHEKLKKLGLVDSTLQPEEEIRGQHEAMRTYVRLRDQGDLDGLFRFLLSCPGFLELSKQPPRCFYSEAVVRPFQPAYRRLVLGDLLARLGRKAEARTYYEEAGRLHVEDRVIEKRLRDLDTTASP